jgi:hypothetical protein
MLSIDEARAIVVTQINALYPETAPALDVALDGAADTGALVFTLPAPDPEVPVTPSAGSGLDITTSPDGWFLSVVEPGRSWRLAREPQY